MTTNKVCPVVLRDRGAVREILAFEHPQAGRQLVKGTIEAGESAKEAALRELTEESGIRAEIVRNLGVWESGQDGQVWAFYECRPMHELPDSWAYYVADGGGHTFQFFWYPLMEPTTADHWHPVFSGALAFIKEALQAT